MPHVPMLASDDEASTRARIDGHSLRVIAADRRHRRVRPRRLSPSDEAAMRRFAATRSLHAIAADLSASLRR
jgi:hypothetical protein